MIDMPNGTTLEETARVTECWPDETLAQQEVVNVQTYVGTSAPYNFNGLVRHYFLRSGAAPGGHPGEPLAEGRAQTAEPRDRHAGAHGTRSRRAEHAGARIKVAEVPPGPPVLQTLVAEVYGPDPARRITLAQDVRRSSLERGVVDVDWYVEAPQPTMALAVDVERAAAAGITPARPLPPSAWRRAARSPGCCTTPRRARTCRSFCGCPIGTGVARHAAGLKVTGRRERRPSVSSCTRRRTEQKPNLYHKNLMPVTYVTGTSPVMPRVRSMRSSR